MNADRTTARIVGVIYLAGFAAGISGNILVQSVPGAANHSLTTSAHSMTLALGAVLWLMAVAGDIAHGVLMFPILKRNSERVAVGYLAFRIVDAVFIAVMVLFILLQIPLGSEQLKGAAAEVPGLHFLSAVFVQGSQYAYDIAMSALGIAGVMLCSAFFRTRLLPRWMAIAGIAGYAIILGGMLSEICGLGFGLLSSIPGGLWEVFAGVWLIAKGFHSSEMFPVMDTTIA